jgi:hypothetical protein
MGRIAEYVMENAGRNKNVGKGNISRTAIMTDNKCVFVVHTFLRKYVVSRTALTV